MKQFYILLLTSFLFGQGQYNHPELDWETIETDHFRIHFYSETENSARLGAYIADSIYNSVTSLYNYKPFNKTDIIFTDVDDISNGAAYFYDNKIIIDLQKQFSMKNKLMVPKIIKVVLNMGLGADANDKKVVKNCIDDIALIGGQLPVVTKFKKSISNFKTRKGSTAGVKVTLRANRMYEFIDRLVNIALPRIKDFQGLSIHGFDNFGNYSFGIKEHIIFPEINFDKVDRIRGMDITLCTNATDRKISLALFKAFNFPFIKTKSKKKAN